MRSAMIRRLLVGAVLLGGLIAGLDMARLGIEMPAWRHVGAVAWAQFSRHADLGNGLIAFPVVAIGGALATIAALVIYRMGGGSPRSAALPMYAAAVLVVCGLVTTVFAAPNMLSLRAVGNDAAAIQRAFDGFELWGGIRSVVQTLAFVANIWSLVKVASADAHVSGKEVAR
ncbi:MAG TPA: hypothetical protein VN947_29515 [Polyangia bacterium]|nr:hypothetical protein [Polyangia bacterium]